MRRVAQAKPQQVQTAIGRQVPAPTGGWDAQSSLANMKPDRAVIMDNFIPRNGYVGMRRGFSIQAGGATGPVQSLLVYRAGGVDQLFAAYGSAIYNASTEGSPLSSVYTGLTSPVVMAENFSNDAGTWLVCFTGYDTPFKYDGTSWTTSAITGTGGSITLDPTKLCNAMLFKRRLHMIERGTRRVWFLGLNAISGTAGLLDLGPVFSKGGALMCMGSWTLDGGNGPDDYACYMTDQGQVAIYKGTDPSDSTAWSLVGVFDMGKPLSQRAIVRYGSDLCVVTTDGVIPLAQALTLDRSQSNLVALTGKIQNAWADAQSSYRTLFGWDGVIYPEGQIAIFNVPTAALSTSMQFAQNMQTGAWCRFLGMNAMCWAAANGNIYFGGVDGVYRADNGSTDNGNPITADLKPAFSAHGYPGRLKRYTMIRPLISAPVGVAPALEIDVDYRDSTPTAMPTVIAPGAETDIQQNWTSAASLGYVAAPRMEVVLQGDQSAYHINIGDGFFLGDGLGNELTDRAPTPFTVPLEVIAFDLQFQVGGQL